jgi:predicted O-linked N-acetylglucosamine transferase (SPINDLY family)
VQVSWLGYFATTGLEVMDAVLLDEWHAPAGTESQFVEHIVRLPGGRFCYTPVPFAPVEVAPPPCVAKGYVTFGSFNNTAKLNPNVVALWAQVLKAVPNARLVLKWRTFQDDSMRKLVSDLFAQHGIAPERLDLRGASFHADLLKEYADIDIALDPFPFTGGLTSCEALWMGVPVVTWPLSQVVSRQTFAFLSAMGLEGLVANSSDDYVRIAAKQAKDTAHLQVLRAGMRTRMLGSPLGDAGKFAPALENALWDVAGRIAAEGLDI